MGTSLLKSDRDRKLGWAMLGIGIIVVIGTGIAVSQLSVDWWISIFIVMIWGLNAVVQGILILRGIVTLPKASPQDSAGDVDDDSK